MPDYWRTPLSNTEHPEGTLFAPPAQPKGCWRVIDWHNVGRALPAPRGCRSKARAGALTCQTHRRDSEAAEAFKASLEGAASVEVTNTEKGRAGAREGKQWASHSK